MVKNYFTKIYLNIVLICDLQHSSRPVKEEAYSVLEPWSQPTQTYITLNTHTLNILLPSLTMDWLSVAQKMDWEYTASILGSMQPQM